VSANGVRLNIDWARLMAATLGPAPVGGPFPLFDAHPRDRAGDHQLLDLARALEDRREVSSRTCGFGRCASPR
jgi:hypothetical protein